ncbi:RNA polymerase sigma-70 factor (ECF subfamily) [Aquimarina sp. EL_43]|uniref:RNA polymerase sigma factor n=1 Tax=unclassified Aquimarina TaxID=2627091 RepID=UPI0018CB218F|nr:MULTISPECIES: RNA polymerase sigma factor [unclassified Aquimarina]MBG6131341.1 RNA polymerase sigma-70 factor (ECF subfamily) [Aquimarina sp. EL_35]MBG6151776.1 RNA polymerase sigma-70 factor (ECF subfamily) [Aquimarina sp. EL_32]MBG6169706.1 RNA polymerase sigma-70 factor (ECF subfamily) [Aquimarina sp. EL_43]
MKVIQFYKSETQLIKRAAKQYRDAQHQLYNQYAPKMLSVCRRYIKDIHFAEEVMLGGFLKVFMNLNKFKFEGSFEGWIRRIMVNESISFLRKEKQVLFAEEITSYTEESWNNINTELEIDQIQELIDSLPEGYRMVFVLYAIEGYKHSEIAKMLEISESTSKSQLFKARKTLQQKLNQQNKISNGAIEI